MESVVERVSIFSTKPIKGVYRYKNKFQIYPSRRKSRNNIFPVTLELSFEKSKPHYFRFSTDDSDCLSREITEIIHLLSLFTQFFFFDFAKSKNPIQKFSNVKFNETEKKEIKWYQDKTLNSANVNEIVVPNFIDRVFDKYYSLSNKEKEIFRKALYLFYSGIELKGKFPSFSFASFVSSLETLISYESPKQKSGVTEKFRVFIIKYAFNDGGNEKDKEFINKVYDYRSKILHSGYLLLAERSWDENASGEQGSLKYWEESFLHKGLLSVTRVCLINWLMGRTTEK